MSAERRLRAVLALLVAVLGLFCGRLFQIQGLDSAALASRALDQRTVDRTLPAHRGDIVDRDGAVLATTVERRNVTVDQTLVHGYKRMVDGKKVVVGVPGAATDLAGVLGLPVDDVRTALTGTRKFAYVTKGISPQLWRRVERLRIPGVFSEYAATRSYPSGAVGASVVGAMGTDGRPLTGIENSLHSALAGKDGSASYEKGVDGRQIPGGLSREVAPVPGGTVRLSIRTDLQYRAETALAEQVRRTGAESGAIVVRDVRSPDILAIATYPTFDRADPGKSLQLLNNHALMDVFEPGSTAKVITAAAAMEEGKVRPATGLVVDGTIRRGGRTFHDSHSHGPEKLTFAGVLAQSSNVGTIMVGERLSPEVMHRYLTAFGVGQKTGVGLPESRGLLAAPQDWNASQRYTVLFGQGVSVTALQATDVFQTIANKGVRIPPRLVQATLDADGSPVPQPRPAGVRVVSERTATELSTILESVVSEEGTAESAQIPGYRVAGKTGTAQAVDTQCGCYRGYTASFIGYAPADDPRLVVSVVLQRPVNGHYGGTVAAPVFKEVMSYALAQEAVPPTGRKAPAVKLTWR
ncbi:MAG: penicillin-binding protein 2 [Kineosporiaceae bacterium]